MITVNRWTVVAADVHDCCVTPTRMPLRTAAVVTVFYALGYPIGNMAVHAMSPMAVLVFRFGLAGLILGT